KNEILSPLGMSFVAGILEHASAAAIFTTPTLNGYKRYKPNSLAPNSIVWGNDNKGAMLRVLIFPQQKTYLGGKEFRFLFVA
ncbi:MAG TPA: hypothetical protein EYM96_12690, partial [Rhodospirillales bacterium]|nr:hypothetical protein [Rhodospirillales bacterium]